LYILLEREPGIKGDALLIGYCLELSLADAVAMDANALYTTYTTDQDVSDSYPITSPQVSYN
jgi:hypothetical protein